MAATDKLRLASNGTQAVPTSLASAMAYGATTATLNVATGWPTATGVDVVMYLQDTSGVKVAGSQTAWVFQLSGTTLSGGVLKSGTMPATGYPSGSSTVVTVRPTAAWGNDVINSLLGIMNQDGSLKTVPIQTALGLGTSSLNGWNALGYAPNTVTANGNRSYSLVFNGVDLTPTLSAGMRLQTARTVAAPTQSTSLNGTSQYYSKASPAGMTFTNNFVVSAWIKVTSYQATDSNIISRWNGTNGWRLSMDSTGIISLRGYNAASASFSGVNSYQAVPLNKWVHVTAQLDMSTFTATPTTSYIMLDGLDVPANVTRGGTNPSALVQAGNLEIGGGNGGLLPFAGKIAQAAIYSAKVAQATILASLSQSLAGTETNLISAYSFNASTSDLNTTNANNLTANGSAVATNADSPYGGQAGGGVSSTLDYAIIQKASFSTNTTLVVQVPEGCTIPTSGGVASAVYSSNKAPYGMPVQQAKWQIQAKALADTTVSVGSFNVWNSLFLGLSVPAGEWRVSLQALYKPAGTTSTSVTGHLTLAPATPANADYSSDFTSESFVYPTGNYNITPIHRTGQLSLATATTYTLYGDVNAATGTVTATLLNSNSPLLVTIENAYL